MKRIFKMGMFFWGIAFMLISCGGGGGGGGDGDGGGGGGGGAQNAKWTYAVYMAGDNNLALSALKDLMEMEMIGSSSNVNIVVQAEFGENYLYYYGLIPILPEDVGLKSWETSRFKIIRDKDPDVIDSPQTVIGDKDMASPQTLADFIRWAKTNFPAEHYVLVLWNHGSGWEGVLQDESSEHYMNMQELKTALQSAGEHFDIIDFDACLMAMYEVAYAVKDYADYMVASEHTEPGDGNPYDLILASLSLNPQMSPSELAKNIVSFYMNYYRTTGEESVTRSAIDLSRFGQFDNLVGEIANLLSSDLESERAKIEQARDSAQSYYSSPNHKDFHNFLSKLVSLSSNQTLKSKAQELMSFISSQLVIKNEWMNGSRDEFNVNGSNGIAIFIPKNVPLEGQGSLSSYEQFSGGTNPAWVDFVQALAPTGSQVTPGNFAFYISWDSPRVDIDLYVQEPNGELASPWIGTVSSNGYLSPDSGQSGNPYESYTAKEYVMKGTYYLFANLYDLGGYSSQMVSFYKDTGSGWQQCAQFNFHMGNPAPEEWWENPNEVQNVMNGVYSDWYIPQNCLVTK